MLTLCKQFKSMMLCFSIVTYLLIGYAESGEPIHEAAKKGNLDEVKRLIVDGAYVDARDENNDTPLFIAVGQGHKEVTELLIFKGANVNAVCWLGYTPLHWAVTALGGEMDLAELLISKGANVNAEDNKGWTPLAKAAYSGFIDLAELLISKGANVNSVDKKGRTPLDLANYSHHKELAELLIKHGGETRSPWTGSPAGRLL